MQRSNHWYPARGMRRVLMIVSALSLLAPLLSSTVGRATDTDAEKAAKEIADARERANAAADAYFASESRIDQLTVEQTQLQSEITSLEGDVKALQLSVENVAIGRYTRSGTSGVPLLTGFQSPKDQVKIDALLEIIYDSSANDFDRFDALNADLADKRLKLADKKDQAVKERVNLASLKTAATAEVQRLKDVEADRLKDQAVQVALIAEQARRKREADRKQLLTAPTPTTPNPLDPSATDPSASAVDDNAADSGDDAAPGGLATRPSLPNAGGGQTGGGGNGSFPGGGGNDYGGPGWVCPTGSAPAPFADTWGAPRSGGRRHQGVDMIGQRGITVYAVVDGVATPRTNALGGTTIWLTGTDGNGYYYAHLDGYKQLGTVTAGTAIGILGQTGNAQFSIPHLHFEVHPGEGPAVNPYPTVAAHCPSVAPAS
jgi:peptidoglycan LD-endopeptidase LytH